MEWNDLSNSAKSIIEWVENPFTNQRETIEIKIGEVFQERALTLEPQTSLYRAKEEMRQTADANTLSNRHGAPTVYNFKNIKN